MNKLLVSAALLSITSFSALAEEATETTVTYDVKRGYAESLSVSQTEQLGEFKVVLKAIKGSNTHNGKNSKHCKGKKSKHCKGPKRHKNKLVIEGVFRGAFDENFTLSHTFVNEARTGALYTSNDQISMVYAGDPTCENGTGTVPFEIEETLNIVAGTGIYAGVEPGSFIVVEGVVNNCPSLPEFGQNNFDVVGGSVIITQ